MVDLQNWRLGWGGWRKDTLMQIRSCVYTEGSYTGMRGILPWNGILVNPFLVLVLVDLFDRLTHRCPLSNNLVLQRRGRTHVLFTCTIIPAFLPPCHFLLTSLVNNNYQCIYTHFELNWPELTVSNSNFWLIDDTLLYKDRKFKRKSAFFKNRSVPDDIYTRNKLNMKHNIHVVMATNSNN